MAHGEESEEEFQARMDAETLERAEEIKADPVRLEAAEEAAKKKIKALAAVVRETSLITGDRKKTLIT